MSLSNPEPQAAVAAILNLPTRPPHPPNTNCSHMVPLQLWKSAPQCDWDGYFPTSPSGGPAVRWRSWLPQREKEGGAWYFNIEQCICSIKIQVQDTVPSNRAEWYSTNISLFIDSTSPSPSTYPHTPSHISCGFQPRHIYTTFSP